MKRKLPYFSMVWLLAVSVLPGQSSQGQNQEMAIFEQVVPNTYASTAASGTFLGPLGNSARTYQMLIADSQLTDLVGKTLTSISYRLLTSASAPWPASSITYSNYDIYLSGSVLPANRSLTFASNVVGVQTQVRSGNLLIPAGALTSGSSPNAYSFDINFTTPWQYTGGNLLIEIRHNGFTGTSTSVEALLTSASGYGTLVSACWTGNYTGTAGTQGNFAIIKLKGTDGLGNEHFSASQYSVYPNPAAGQIHIEGSAPMTKLRLFNMLGQMVLEEEAAESLAKTLDLSALGSGTYLLQIESGSGVHNQKVVKK